MYAIKIENYITKTTKCLHDIHKKISVFQLEFCVTQMVVI